MPAEHVDAGRKPIEGRRRSLGRDGEGKHCTAFGADEGLADAECLEAINALWRAAFNACNVLLYCGLEKNCVC